MEVIIVELKINNLDKIINGKMVLKNINFKVSTGQVLGIIGRNGVGKTTLFRTIIGQYLADQGQVLIDNTDLDKHIELKQSLFFFDQQNSFINDLLPIQIAKYYQKIYDKLNINEFINNLQKHNLPLNTRYRSYSKGMQGLFNVLLAIASKAEFIILDEPFDGLDILVKENVKRLLIQLIQLQETALLISSHNLAELDSLIDQAIIIADAEVKSRYELEDMRVNTRKIQLVFKDEFPSFIEKYGTIVEKRGRVYVVIFNNYSKEIDEQIAISGPLLFEELPLTLEDLFRTTLVNESDYILEK